MSAGNRPFFEAGRRHLFLMLWQWSGSLYTTADWDASFELEMREECEEAGLPMGYGRVCRAPAQLSDDEQAELPRSLRRN